jgi:hypothetical protein
MQLTNIPHYHKPNQPRSCPYSYLCNYLAATLTETPAAALAITPTATFAVKPYAYKASTTLAC